MVISDTAFLRAVMTGAGELTISALMVYPVGGRRWTKLYVGPPDAAEAREILSSLERGVKTLLAALEPTEEPERWYEGMYRR